MSKNTEAYIKDNKITIEVDINDLQDVVLYSWSAGYLHAPFKIIDKDEFAKEFCHVLNDESEDGTTKIHELFDGALMAAFENNGDATEELSEEQAEEMIGELIK